MEWIIIIAVFAAILLAGRFALWLFKDFFELVDAQSSSKTRFILLFGKAAAADELAKLFDENNLKYLQVDSEAQINKEASFSYLIGASDSDLDNLLISRMGERIMNISNQLLLCNESRNEGIFKDNGMPYLCKADFSAQEVFRRIKSV